MKRRVAITRPLTFCAIALLTILVLGGQPARATPSGGPPAATAQHQTLAAGDHPARPAVRPDVPPPPLDCIRKALTPDWRVAWPAIKECTGQAGNLAISIAQAWLQQLCVAPPDFLQGPVRDALCDVHITGTSTRQEGVLIYLSVSFVDLPEFARGFGFRGVNGSGWAEENHPFTAPSYGRVSLTREPFPGGRVEYPFNHGCGTGHQIQTDVQFWIYDLLGKRAAVTQHLTCAR